MIDREMLDEKVICESGSWGRVRRWWRGTHAEIGTITKGWSGWETVEERDRVRAVHTFTVVELDHAAIVPRDQMSDRAA